ncbi:unnamed protein product [Phyllotreta striolata]|uniref:C-type lectin domain-containing protein n=1 Tax=Phyllotreta striolata TaxID=444603 RepID=A0A9N9TCW6_PHYSR|nr:unnamed protein product [Phyllotreta striolata]
MLSKLVLTISFSLCFLCACVHNEEYVSQYLQSRRTTNWFNYVGKTYYVDTVFKTNYYKAMHYCRQQGMQLLTITSEAENKKIEEYLKEKGLNGNRYWTAATNLGDRPDRWVWSSTGHLITYFKWDAGEPNNTDSENCIEGAWFTTNGFTWNDVTCLRSNHFICEATTDCYNLKC